MKGIAGLTAVLVLGSLATPARAQVALPQDRIADDTGTSRRYAELVRLSSARIERALVLDSDDEERRVPLALEAERYAREAIGLSREEPEAWFLMAAALGLRTEFASGRSQVRLAAEAWAAADSALARDPDHAGAHHVLGRLNFEAMKVSGFTRLVATHLFGSTLMRRASWAQAERHFRRAAEAEPDVAVHRIWLARLHAQKDDVESARRFYRSVMDDPADTELERRWRDEARAELADL